MSYEDNYHSKTDIPSKIWSDEECVILPPIKPHHKLPTHSKSQAFVYSYKNGCTTEVQYLPTGKSALHTHTHLPLSFTLSKSMWVCVCACVCFNGAQTTAQLRTVVMACLVIYVWVKIRGF